MDEFYVSYIEGSMGYETKKSIKKFVFLIVLSVCIGAFIFSFSQQSFKNSSFELTTATKITGVFHQNPYPMLRVEVAKNEYKNILLLGFGKSGATPFLEKTHHEVEDLNGKRLAIEGNLIYYNGKTLIQITDENKVSFLSESKMQLPKKRTMGSMTLTGEIIDPKCYFGVMKPGKGKIHRSCAIRCVSGGIPPVLATTDNNNLARYFLITDIHGAPIHKEVLPFIGKPAEITGIVEKMEDWYVFKVDTEKIKELGKKSTIY